MAREDQKMRSEAVRRAILDTALEMGIREGFEAVTVRKIIHAMKYSTGVVYHHFKDKQEILDAIEEEQTQRLRAVMMELSEHQDAIGTMLAVFHRVMQLALEEPERYNLIVLHKYSRSKPGRTEWLATISANLQKAMQAGQIRQMDADKAAFSLWSSFLGFNLMISRQTGLTAAEAEELFKVQSDILTGGLLPGER